ncbi:N-acetyl-gamma-glutamyl-phosphate reductase [Lujinxingia litoralis]|uniref:N-acetyl-gamma-glutamyl-phosphate reductase n=1 Tax=Lujinxingia litoralis TaxID=2211119 RepID=A0A328C6K4_9DELT|nr:N-acetyl-gamma-glutamyl-phosphate reductase [Lujinxingia litoralis]RAL22886.1 N-acetyl-gamma-glutamyl-phosphate reductase [Lujinxingia litoralis]
MNKKTVGLIGARGHTGSELIPLLARHPGIELACVSSRELAGERVSDHVQGGPEGLTFEALSPADVAARGLDAVILALPNGVSETFVTALDNASPTTVIIDLSADHRFDAAWTYGQPERNREAIARATRIANPGCYATGMQLALLPFLDLLANMPHVFGVSGYSGAGTTPSPKNDPEVLRDNLLPYALTGHIHEREVSEQLGQEICFIPHVASFFRGITLTITCDLTRDITPEEALERTERLFGDEPLIQISKTIPLVRDAAGSHQVHIGGFHTSPEGRRPRKTTEGQPAGPTTKGQLTLVATLDNLLKGAATQALQNLNLTLGFDELEGVPQ